ncbi:alpha/beta fold hydrolase [Protaetiibacter sp. SSC-01]|uniref:alpha/beta fold hydrolase n=1 Tax=Protaetiibacter sp. SSC-01 TaxID=2759943 RepID=UPI001656D941|nr:alpha/beta fold hydrolase [Protaetiibacter sp. SSC-01]QNO37943.1 alpha/beta fold hydrolase [Protaetiibacter sp. SSC-01]
MTTAAPTDVASAYRDAEARLLAEYGLARADDRMVEMPDARTRLHVIELAGDDRLPVVLLHGMAAVTAAAIPLIPAFGGRRVIAPDWPGHGLSDAAELPPDGLRDVPLPLLDAVLADAGVERAHLVGHSMGAQFALYYALARPERVASLTILGAPGVALPGTHAPFSMRLMAFPGLAQLFTAPVSRERYEANSAMTLGTGTVAGWPRELVDVGWYASLRPEFRETAPRYYRALGRRELTLTSEELASVDLPVHALWGDDDVFLKPPAGRAGLASVADLTFTAVPGGHAPWLNSPGPSEQAVRAFLDARP